MSTGTIPTCASRLSAATLSAWRDNALSAAEAERVRAHVAGCTACQGRLAEYEALAGIVRGQRVAEPDERLWRAVRAEMAGRRTGRRGFPHAFNTSGAWRSLAAVAAVLLLVVSFAKVLQLGSLHRVVATRTPTATEAPPQLSWQPAANQGVPPTGGQTPAPSDGSTAYMCTGGGAAGQQVTVWATHDLAAHWTRTHNLPPTGQTADQSTECALAVDATDARMVALTVYWHVGRAAQGPSGASTFVTTDGGATWQVLTEPKPFTIAAMATYRGITYAILSTGVNPPMADLSASSNGLRTWQSIDQGISAAGQQIDSFWVNQGSGEILAEATSQTNPSDTASLWDTRDGGRAWKRLPGPTLTIGTILVQTPSAAGQPWHICDLYQGATDPRANQLLCTTDGGQTWLPHPTLNYTYTCSKCGVPGTPTTEVFQMTPIALADDGALLAIVEESPTPFTVPSTDNPKPTLTLYRLRVGSRVWQSLGALTGGVYYGTMVYCAGPGQGLLWSINGVATFTAVYP